MEDHGKLLSLIYLYIKWLDLREVKQAKDFIRNSLFIDQEIMDYQMLRMIYLSFITNKFRLLHQEEINY
jgi:hypothetical protein